MNSYEKTITVRADPAAVLPALTGVDGLSAWWTRATGDAAAGGEIRLWFGHPDPLVMRVLEASSAAVRWEVVTCDFVPDWVGTRPTFTISAIDQGSEIHFVHQGLTPELDCIDMCTQGWNHFIASLGRYVDTGVGAPKGSPDDLARR